MIYKLKIFIIIFSLTSCSGVQFIYNDSKSITNPLYKKTVYEFTGRELSALNKYAAFYLGNSNKPEYSLRIDLEEKKTRKSIQSNQTVSKVDYSLTIGYSLFLIEKDCVVYNKLSNASFSYLPKSAGFNFGSDESLNQLYDLAIKRNIYAFVSGLGDKDLKSCIDEN